MDRVHEILDFWFGSLGSADLPTSERTNLWFGNNDEIKLQFVSKFTTDHDKAIADQLDAWEETPRGRLALILLYDQLSRYKYKGTDKAFSKDESKLQCVKRVSKKKWINH